MRNSLTIIIASCFLVIGLFQSSHGQQTPVSTVAAAEERGTRDQDGLEGPVRRVRVETARMMVKGGKTIEGPRVVRGITTYDPAGKKIDAVDYPIESGTVSGNERYRYDDKGNIVEMVVVDSGGSILSKEAYEYEFDAIGNWTRMNTSVAIYEDGKVTFEPTEVTYRTISYYYNQAIEKISNATAKSKAPALRSTPSPRVAPSEARVPTKPVTTNPPVADKVAEVVKEKATDPVPVAPAVTQTTDTVANNAAVPDESNTSTIAPKPVVKVEEALLRSAAIDLPNPEYPEAALLARAAGKVEVQLLVNEKGLVANARAQGGNPFLNQAAEIAALKARFSPTRLSAEPAMAFGVITYNFTPPEAQNAPLASNAAPERTPPIADAQKMAQVQTENRTAFVAPQPAMVSEIKSNPERELLAYDKGVALLAVGDYAKAADEFTHAVRMNPNDANAYVKLALSYARLNKNKEAIASYKMAAQIERTAVDAAAYHSWGRSYLALDKNSDAISAFKQALLLMKADTIGAEPKTLSVPSPAQVHFDLGTAYINSRRFGDSIKQFKQVVALSPANAEAHYALAIAYISDGNRRAAEDVNKVLATLNRTLSEKIVFALVAPESRHGCRNIACR